MKFWAIGSLLLSLSAFAFDEEFPLPDGVYVGEGRWHDNLGNFGGYDSHVQFIDNQMISQGAWAGGGFGYRLAFDFAPDGDFVLIFANAPVGGGHCEDQLCEYEAVVDGVRFGERFEFGDDGEFHKAGYKILPDRIVEWDEALVLYSSETDTPEDPTDPAFPADDAEQTDPGVPADDADQTAPAVPVDDADQTAPAWPIDDTNQLVPVVPVDDVNQTEPALPVDDSNQVDPSWPVDYIEPVVPAWPVDQIDLPAGPAQDGSQAGQM